MIQFRTVGQVKPPLPLKDFLEGLGGGGGSFLGCLNSRWLAKCSAVNKERRRTGLEYSNVSG